jgi:hypothetical protein
MCLSQYDADEGFFLTLLDFVGTRKVALLQAYFDESERDNGLLCVAGYAFAAEQARKLTKEFKFVFGPYGGFHMADLVSKHQGYKGISDADRVRLIKEAVAIVRSRFSFGVAVTVNISEYEAKAPRFIRGFGNAYPFLCHLAMTAIAELATKHGDSGPIHYLFEAGHAYEAEARHAVSQVTLVPELKKLYLHSGDSFVPKQDAVPLQAADLLAWEMGKFKNETVDEPIRKLRMSLRALLDKDPKRYHVSFCGGDLLTRTLNRFRQLALEQIQEEHAARATIDSLRKQRN